MRFVHGGAAALLPLPLIDALTPLTDALAPLTDALTPLTDALPMLLATASERGDRRWLVVGAVVVALAVFLPLSQRRATLAQRRNHLLEQIQTDLTWLLDDPHVRLDDALLDDYLTDLDGRATRLTDALRTLAGTSSPEVREAAAALGDVVDELARTLVARQVEPVRRSGVEAHIAELGEQASTACRRLRRSVRGR